MIIVQGLVESATSEEVLLTGSGDGSVKLWRLTHENNEAPIPWFELENGDDAVLSLAIEGSLLYCGLAGGALNIWNLDSRQLVKQITEHQGDLWALDIMDGIAIAGDAEGVIKVRIDSRRTCIHLIIFTDVSRNSIRASKRLAAGQPTRAQSWPLPPDFPTIGVSMQLVEMTTLSLSGI